MRIGIAVDSACDLPQEFITQNKIQILPITIHLDGKDFVDNRDPVETQNFYDNHLTGAGDAGTSPFSVEQIKNVFLSKLVLDFDFVFCLTIMSSRSPIFEHATKASFAILADYKAVRAAASVPGPFALRVIDTQNLFAGQAVLAIEAVKMIKQGLTPQKIRAQLEALVQNTYTYMVPRDLHYIRARGQKKGDRSVGWFSVMMGSALDIKPLLRGFRNETTPVAKLRHFDDASEKCFGYVKRLIVGKKLLAPTLCLGYGGKLADMERLPGFDDLMATCREHKIDVFKSVMSITSVVNVGEGSLNFAFVAQEHELDL